MRILVTAFGAFGKIKTNPSEQILRRLSSLAQSSGNEDLYFAILPVEYGAAGRKIRRLIRSLHPEGILCLGVAASRQSISLERLAVNLDDDPAPDNAGRIRRGRVIEREGPAAYWSTLPLERMGKALRKIGTPATMSNNAGNYVCNHVFYVARREVERSSRKIPCGFIHVPGIRRNTKGRRGHAMTIDEMALAVQSCLRVLQSSGAKRAGSRRLSA